MGKLADLPLEQLLKIAQEVGALDRWEVAEDVIVFENATMSIAVEEPNGKPFVRGLLRGYELALAINERSKSGGERP